MNDTREILKRALGNYAPRPGRPDDARDRAQRRRRTNRVVSGVVAFALFLAAGGALWLAFDGSPGRRVSRPADTPTSQSFRAIVNGLGIERPAGWTLVEPGSSIRVPAGEGSSQWPLLLLSNFDAQLGLLEYGPRAACQGSDRVPSDGLSLYLMRDIGRPLTAPEHYEAWPASLNVDHVSDGACGKGAYTYWTSAGKDFEAFVVTGTRVPDADLAIIRSTFTSMDFSFASAQDSFHAAADGGDSAARLLHETSSKLVLAGGDGTGADSRPWTMSVMQDPNRVLEQSTAVVVVEVWSPNGADVWIIPENWPDRSLGFTSWCSKEMSNLVVGQVNRDVSRLDLISSEGAISRPEILPVPESVGAPFDAFIGRLPDAQQGTLVALSSADEELYTVGGTDGPGCEAPAPSGP
jgi:hypothetical protein